MTGNVEEGLEDETDSTSVAVVHAKARTRGERLLTLGTSRESGLKRVPLEEPPTL